LVNARRPRTNAARRPSSSSRRSPESRSLGDNDPVWGTGTSSDLVKQELERVLQSKAFRNAEALSKLLRFIVERTLQADTEGLKEYSLGSQVLDRGPGFDPQADPIVRVQAGRLRLKLNGYYHTEGKYDTLRIDLPRGGYIPEFTSAKLADDSIDRHIRLERAIRLTCRGAGSCWLL
jgi:hypothetical protein